MTYEEAIKELKVEIELYDNEIVRLDAFKDTPDRRLIDALEMAIEALEKQNKESEYCEYCDGAKALVIGKTDDIGIAIRYPYFLMAYGYDVHGLGSNGIEVKINYCPICGKELKK